MEITRLYAEKDGEQVPVTADSVGALSNSTNYLANATVSDDTLEITKSNGEKVSFQGGGGGGGGGDCNLHEFKDATTPTKIGWGTKESRKANETIGNKSITFGNNNTASGLDSYAEGNSTVASGLMSHAEGTATTASDSYSHAEGHSATASGQISHAEGYATRASGYASHAEGQETKATNEAEHAQGKYNASHTNTIDSIGIGTSDSDRKNATETMNDGKHYILGVGGYDGTNPGATGVKDLATVISEGGGGGGDCNLLRFENEYNNNGYGTEKSRKEGTDVGYYSITFGENNSATNNDSYAEGYNSESSGFASHAEGSAKAINSCTHAEGYSTASGETSHAEGEYSNASAKNSHAEGSNTKARGYCSHSEGNSTDAGGDNSHAEGCNTETTNDYEHAQGTNNSSHTGTIDSVGIGEGWYAKKNATETMMNGKHYIFGIGGYDGTNPDTAKDIATVINEILAKLG